MGYWEDRAEAREDYVAEKATEERWWRENFPEPTMETLREDNEMATELARLRRQREALEQRLDKPRVRPGM